MHSADASEAAAMESNNKHDAHNKKDALYLRDIRSLF